jgi:hypothetical protein
MLFEVHQVMHHALALEVPRQRLPAPALLRRSLCARGGLLLAGSKPANERCPTATYWRKGRTKPVTSVRTRGGVVSRPVENAQIAKDHRGVYWHFGNSPHRVHNDFLSQS